MTRPAPKRVLAVAVTSRGYGFALLEGPEHLVDWGVTQPRPYRENQCLAQLRQTMERYGPDILAIEDAAARPRSCSARVRDLHGAIRDLAKSLDIRPRAFAWRRVRLVFHPDRRMTKYGIARVIAKVLPPLAPRVPRYRKPWMSEEYSMAIFEAAALGLTYYQSLPRYRNFLHNHLPHA